MIERRKLVLFITCLSLAIVAWLSYALSNRYIYNVRTRVNYVNSPEQKAFHALQSDTVMLHIEGSGWQLLFSRMRISPQNIDVNLRKLNEDNYIVFAQQLNEINSQLGSNQRVVSVIPDTLHFDFSDRNTKRVPVKLAYDIQYRKSFNISGPVQLVPAFVTVSGLPEDLAQIDYWLTDSLKITDAVDDVLTRIPLKRSPDAGIRVHPAVVNVKIPVDEFTEKSLEIPLRVLNNTGYDIKLLPEKVTVTFLTSLSGYAGVNRETIEATIDMEPWQNKGYRQLPVSLSRFPDFCKLVSIEPQIVDFIIE